MTNNILQYESEIWATADLLRGSGIKESEWPSYMMPFFALIMIESRLLRLFEEEIKIAGGEEAFNAMREDDRLALLLDKKQGYNKYLFEQKKSLKDICANDKTFEIDFDSYLKGFDDETKDLLGVDPGEEGERFLNIKNYISILKTKKVLFAYVRKWSEIDLKPYSNSDITTLEEHIKRKWADMSAETAGEQYTPDDVIALMAEIVASKIEEKETLLKIYDPACGGGNLLFGVEDRIKEVSKRYTQTFGQEINDALFALAKIESRFREDSKIEDGNTLVADAFFNDEFDVSVANPPFGVDWKGYASDIRKDKTGRYKYLPSVSNGQLLFLQHLISKMSHDGIGVVVDNGSALFSGEAGSSESNTRKWLLENDIVEAIIQLPADEFFNTNIYTYLLVLNKNKKPYQKNKVMLIDASSKFKPLKKKKGEKRNEIEASYRKEITDVLSKFTENEYSRIFEKEHFYYNKQAISLIGEDVNGKAFIGNETLVPVKLENGERTLSELPITSFDVNKYQSLKEAFEHDIKPFIESLDYKEQPLVITTERAKYWFDTEQETLIKEESGKRVALGCGKIVIKSSFKRGNKKQPERIEINIEITTDAQKDYEIIPFHKDEALNQVGITAFMEKYITKSFQYLENTIGVEVNFNKVFYEPEQVTEVSSVLGEIRKIDDQLKAYSNLKESIINETATRGLNRTKAVKDSGIEWIGEIPSHWEVKRISDVAVQQKIPNFGLKEKNLLSLSYGKLKRKDIETSTGLLPESFETYQIVNEGNIVLRLTDLQNDWTSLRVGLARERGIITSAYLCLRFSKAIHPAFAYYLLHVYDLSKIFYWLGNGLRSTMKFDDIKALPFVIPPFDEQKAIAQYLDDKTALIERSIDTINSEIEILKELKKSLANDFVKGKIKVV